MPIRQSIQTTLRILARDAGRLARNPVAMIVLAGAILMPSIYAWYCIAANWDPYQNTSAIKVAVVNLDEGADVPAVLSAEESAKGSAKNPAEASDADFASNAATRINIGAEVVAKMRDNDQLGWEFTAKSTALEGVKSGEYYAAIVIPAQFSADFASIATGSYTHPRIDYYVNEKLSAVAPKITDTGITSLEEQIDQQFVATVSEAVAETLRNLGISISDKATSATDTLMRDVEQAQKAAAAARALIDDALPTVSAAQATAADAQATLSLAAETADGLDASLSEAEGSLANLRQLAEDAALEAGRTATLAHTALQAAARQVSASLADAADALAQHQASIDSALEQAEHMLAENEEIIEALTPLAESSPEAAQAIEGLQRQNAQLEDIIASLQQLSDEAAAAAEAARVAQTALAGALADFASAAGGAFTSKPLSALNSALDSLAVAIGSLRGAAAALSPLISQAQATLAQFESVLTQAEQAASITASSLSTLQDSLGTTLADLQALQASSAAQGIAALLDVNPRSIASFMAEPVKLDTQVIFPIRNYGSGVAPFYINLALWVTCFILAAILKTRVDQRGLPPFTEAQAYFARSALFAILALVSGAIVLAGCLVMGTQCANPAAFMFAGLLTMLVDITFVYALVHAFRHMGKALAVILLIMQIPGSSGMYPVEMMPGFFQFIHPLLPFTYSIGALREAIGGMNLATYAANLTHLLPFIPLGLVIGLGAGKLLRSIGRTFDRKLAETDLLEAEYGEDRETYPNDPARQSATRRPRLSLTSRTYRKLITAGWTAVFGIPALIFATMTILDANVDEKVFLLAVMVAGLFAIAGYLIIVEHLHEREGAGVGHEA